MDWALALDDADLASVLYSSLVLDSATTLPFDSETVKSKFQFVSTARGVHHDAARPGRIA